MPLNGQNPEKVTSSQGRLCPRTPAGAGRSRHSGRDARAKFLPLSQANVLRGIHSKPLQQGQVCVSELPGLPVWNGAHFDAGQDRFTQITPV